MDQSSRNLNPTPLIAGCTRWLQARFPQRPIKGLTRFSTLLSRWLPAFQGVIQLEDHVLMRVDSKQSAERWLLYSGNYQPALTQALKQHTPSGGFCLDIGANLGFYTVKFARWVGSSGRVAAFEANPDLVAQINHNISLNQFSHVNVVGAAVHNQPGEIEFYVSSSPGKSSVNPIDSTTRKIVVTAITLDDYISSQNWPRLDVIKMDIEGNDCNALLGARNTLTRFRPFIIFEYKKTTPAAVAEEAFDFIDSLHYDVRSLTYRGKQSPFDWRNPGDAHVDIICDPK